MVGEYMVCVDRIIASAACFEPVDERERNSSSESSVAADENNAKISGGDGGGCSKPKGVLGECRICQEEDEEHQMESPCACNGTLKFAHRKCIQKWCNKKGDVTCEICNQVFSPNYTFSPARGTPDVLAIDIRQAWGQHIDLRDTHFLALAAGDRQFVPSEYEDYAIANSGTLACLRYVAISLMLLLLIRQTLMLIRDFGMVQESSAFFHFQISLLQLVGFLLPCYVMARSWYVVLCRRRRQG